MDLLLTEKQLKLILSKQIEEDDAPAGSSAAASDAQPQTGTSQASGGQGYPAVDKWESGATRGPANQVGVTKWSDVVGASLKRGKANPLK